MTYRLTLGVDPGQTGAIAVMADREFVSFIDIPTQERPSGGRIVDAQALAAQVRGATMNHRGVYVYGVIEQVMALPKQGSTSGFNFGQSDGFVRGVLGALGIPLIEVRPQTWKAYLQLAGKIKDPDAARQMAIRLYPDAAPHLSRKKDGGRADALLIARWALLTEQVARAA